MAQGDMTDYGEEVYSMLRGGCGVKVYCDFEKGTYLVVRNSDGEELAAYSFRGGQRGSLSRERAEQYAKEYANGYVTGYNDRLEDE